jgi:hypothetical protein
MCRVEWHGVELLAACGPFPAGTAGSLGTWLSDLCQHPLGQNVPIPYVWWLECRGGQHCGLRGKLQTY